jgi:two-component system, OmpR family, alkaline phosphatase synthesis response regulator PhoP
MSTQSVLVVEDDHHIRELVSYNLLREGFQVAGVASAEEALVIARSRPLDLILVDLMLPGMDGLTLCRTLKADPETAAISLVILTAKGEDRDIVTGLNLGAEDYITKPFSPKVLVARVRAVLRRRIAPQPTEADSEEADEVLEAHGLMIHSGRHEVQLDGQPIELTSTEFRVLRLLASRPGWVLTRQQILDGVHGDNYAITDRAVDVQVVGLRKKLGSAGSLIETVRGVGYRFKE